MTEPLTVLMVEDDESIRRMLSIAISTEGLRVIHATTIADAQQSARESSPDLYLVDLGLPDGDGIALIRSLRTWTKQPIIVVSAMSAEDDKVEALSAGADDYVVKPVSIEELRARVRVACRRLSRGREGAVEKVFSMGSVRVDIGARRVTRGDEEIRLTPIEFRLLHEMCAYAGKSLPKRKLLQAVWGPSYEFDTQYLHIYIKRLRDKLEDCPKEPNYILTDLRYGYRLVATEALKESQIPL